MKRSSSDEHFKDFFFGITLLFGAIVLTPVLGGCIVLAYRLYNGMPIF